MECGLYKIIGSITTLCLRKKRHPFYICDNLVIRHSILLIFGRTHIRELETNTRTQPTTSQHLRHLELLL